MPTLVTQLPPFETSDGRIYAAQACGAERADGRWDGWLAFFNAQGDAWRTPRETVQPSLAALEHWAVRLTATDLEDARLRALPAPAEAAVTD
jgi:hypothetical protein